MAGNAKDRPENMGGTGGTSARKGGDVAGKAQDVASSAGQKAQDMASNLGQKAQQFASTAAERAGDAASAVGERMSSLAGTLREKVPQGGTLGTAAAAVADGLEAGGQYLGEHDLNDLVEEVNSLVRRYPLQSVLVGLGVGCLVGMAVSRR